MKSARRCTEVEKRRTQCRQLLTKHIACFGHFPAIAQPAWLKRGKLESINWG